GHKGMAAAALVRQDDLQPLLGNAGALFLFAEQEGKKGRHRHLLPNRRFRKPPFCASMKRIGLSLPRKRSITSLYASDTSLPFMWTAGGAWLEARRPLSLSGMTPMSLMRRMS